MRIIKEKTIAWIKFVISAFLSALLHHIANARTSIMMRNGEPVIINNEPLYTTIHGSEVITLIAGFFSILAIITFIIAVRETLNHSKYRKKNKKQRRKIMYKNITDELIKEKAKQGDVAWILDAAEKGYAMAQSYYGDWCDFGDYGLKNTSEAFKWYTKAAEQGDKEAQFALGSLYKLREVTAEMDASVITQGESFKRARYWFMKAATDDENGKGLILAQDELGSSYLNGDQNNNGEGKDEEKFLYWCKKASDGGHANSMLRYGMYLYETYFKEKKQWEEANTQMPKSVNLPDMGKLRRAHDLVTNAIKKGFSGTKDKDYMILAKDVLNTIEKEIHSF